MQAPPAHAPQHETAFGGPSGGMRSEMNIGADGGERSSVKVHHRPGGEANFNIFGGYGYDAAETTTSSGSYGAV